VIEVACSKCEWKAGFSRAELLAMYGAECPLPTLLNHLAMPGANRNTIAHRKFVIAAAAKHRLPAIYSYRYFVEDGGCMEQTC
jgi:hypothetical protein